MTSNVGNRHLIEGVTGDEIPERVMADLRLSFRPQFFNCIGETTVSVVPGFQLPTFLQACEPSTVPVGQKSARKQGAI